jgi:hypothetical protein
MQPFSIIDLVVSGPRRRNGEPVMSPVLWIACLGIAFALLGDAMGAYVRGFRPW